MNQDLRVGGILMVSVSIQRIIENSNNNLTTTPPPHRLEQMMDPHFDSTVVESPLKEHHVHSFFRKPIHLRLNTQKPPPKSINSKRTIPFFRSNLNGTHRGSSRLLALSRARLLVAHGVARAEATARHGATNLCRPTGETRSRRADLTVTDRH